MIPFDFIYCRPNTLSEAADAYAQLQSEGRAPVYYAGGSEIITMCRVGAIHPGAVIDIKHIPTCTLLESDDQALHIGSACTLHTIKESNRFPLLRLACGRIADHTNQCRITLPCHAAAPSHPARRMHRGRMAAIQYLPLHQLPGNPPCGKVDV